MRRPGFGVGFGALAIGFAVDFMIALAVGGPVGFLAAPREARACSVFDPHPCTPGVGSVLRDRPYTPYSCGVYSYPGCVPLPYYPLNQVPVLKVQGHVGPSEPLDRDHPANKINEMGPLLSKCLELPPDDEARPGMRVTLKLAFKRDGELLAEPRFTYTTHEAPPDVKSAYQDAARAMLKRCTPLPVTASLGEAIAGRPFVIPIIETRTEAKAAGKVEQKTEDKAGAPDALKPADAANDQHP